MKVYIFFSQLHIFHPESSMLHQQQSQSQGQVTCAGFRLNAAVEFVPSQLGAPIVEMKKLANDQQLNNKRRRRPCTVQSLWCNLQRGLTWTNTSRGSKGSVTVATPRRLVVSRKDVFLYEKLFSFSDVFFFLSVSLLMFQQVSIFKLNAWPRCCCCCLRRVQPWKNFWVWNGSRS